MEKVSRYRTCGNPLCNMPVLGRARFCCDKCARKARDLKAPPRLCLKCGAEFRSYKLTQLCDACYYAKQKAGRKKKKTEEKPKNTFAQFIEAQKAAAEKGIKLRYGAWMARKEGRL